MRDRVFVSKGEIMVRFGMVAAALALMASPLLAQESTDDLKKELEQLRKEVDSLKAVNSTKELPAMGKINADAMAADDSPIMTLFKGTKLSGFVDAAWGVSFNHLHSSVMDDNPVRLFDNRDNSFYLHNVQLQLERLATKDMIVGYHVELQAGHDTTILSGSNVDLQEGWIQILAPIGTGLDVRVGKMATLIGYEVVENTNNLNYSRGALYTVIEPITATGVRASYSFVEQFSATIGFNNGLNFGDNFSDDDHSKMLELQALIKPIKDLWIAINLNWGNDLAINGTNAPDFYIFNIVAEYKMDKLTLALNFDQASAQFAGGGRAPFRGVAVYGKYQLTDIFATGVRLEYGSDQLGGLGFGPAAPGDTGTGSRIITITLTEELKIAQHAILRFELRHDSSNNHDFSRGNNGANSARGDTTFAIETLLPF